MTFGWTRSQDVEDFKLQPCGFKVELKLTVKLQEEKKKKGVCVSDRQKVKRGRDSPVAQTRGNNYPPLPDNGADLRLSNESVRTAYWSDVVFFFIGPSCILIKRGEEEEERDRGEAYLLPRSSSNK